MYKVWLIEGRKFLKDESFPSKHEAFQAGKRSGLEFSILERRGSGFRTLGWYLKHNNVMKWQELDDNAYEEGKLVSTG